MTEAQQREALELLAELADQHQALLTEHGKPFGWGLIPVILARELLTECQEQPTCQTSLIS